MSFWRHLAGKLPGLFKFIFAWLAIRFFLVPIHEGSGHAFIDAVFGGHGIIEVIYADFGKINGIHIVFPVAGYYIPDVWPAGVHLALTALAGGLVTALFFIWIDRHVEGFHEKHRYVDWSLNFWWAEQLTYSVGETLLLLGVPINMPLWLVLGYVVGAAVMVGEMFGKWNV